MVCDFSTPLNWPYVLLLVICNIIYTSAVFHWSGADSALEACQDLLQSSEASEACATDVNKPASIFWHYIPNSMANLSFKSVYRNPSLQMVVVMVTAVVTVVGVPPPLLLLLRLLKTRKPKPTSKVKKWPVASAWIKSMKRWAQMSDALASFPAAITPSV